MKVLSLLTGLLLFFASCEFQHIKTYPFLRHNSTGFVVFNDKTLLNFSGRAIKNFHTSAENFTSSVTYLAQNDSDEISIAMVSDNYYGYPHSIKCGINKKHAFFLAGDKMNFKITSPNEILYKNGDSMKLTLIRKLLTYTVKLENLNSYNNIVITINNLNNKLFPANNTCHYEILNQNVNLMIINQYYEINEKPNPYCVIVGNSITAGEAATEIAKRYSSLIFPNRSTIVDAGGGDYSQNVVDKLPEIVGLNPKYVCIMIGGNDVLFGINQQIINHNLNKIRNLLNAHNISIIWLAPTPRNQVDMRPLKQYLDNFKNSKNNFVIDGTFDGLFNTKTSFSLLKLYDSGDGTHLNDSGMAKVASIINNYILLKSL